ncbi:hypothetical protein ACIA5D_38225 [Actinoplanes sp. NPDC051513]|uniref:hypothetical protein n=1 Tax=Actinoplanes sp. NPDC051513 TaxID=3363908 RepID=UPI0037A1DEA4
MTSANDLFERQPGMFPYSDPNTTLDLHRQRVAEMIRVAADHERARTAQANRPRRFGRWRSKEQKGRGGHVTATA